MWFFVFFKITTLRMEILQETSQIYKSCGIEKKKKRERIKHIPKMPIESKFISKNPKPVRVIKTKVMSFWLVFRLAWCRKARRRNFCVKVKNRSGLNKPDETSHRPMSKFMNFGHLVHSPQVSRFLLALVPSPLSTSLVLR